MILTWPEIELLHAHRGKVDTDSGKLFVRYAGRAISNDTYDGEVILKTPRAEGIYESFSLSEVLKTPPHPPTPQVADVVTEESTDGSNSNNEEPAEDSADEHHRGHKRRRKS